MSTVIETIYQGKYRSTTQSPLSESPITADAARFSPVDLLASAYGSCLLGTVDYAARKNQFETTNARSEIDYEMSGDKSKVGAIHIKLFFGDNFTVEQKQIIEFAAQHECHVGKSLDPAIQKKFEFFYNIK